MTAVSELGAGDVDHASVGTSVSTVTLDGDYQVVSILKRTSAGELFVTVDGSNPAVDGAGSHCMPEGVNELVLRSPSGATTVVKLIASAGTIKASVTGLRP